MQRFARIEGDSVIELIELSDDLKPGKDVYTPEFAAQLVLCANSNVKPGWNYLNEKFTEPTVEVRDIATVRSELKSVVDTLAEAERLKYITPGNGQAMTYQQKVTEAQAYKVATNPQASEYPMLLSEVGITAETLDEVADIVLAAFAQWQQIGAIIEAIRLGAKRDIDAAENEAAARALVDAIVWPSAQQGGASNE